MASFSQYAAGDTRFNIAADEVVRKFSFGTHWMKVRIGVRLAFYTAGATISNAGFAIGFCQGDTVTFAHPNTINYVGFALGSGGTSWTGTLTYNAGAGNPYYITATASTHTFVTKLAGALSTSVISGTTSYVTANPAGAASLLYVELTKLPAGYTVSLLGPAGAATGQTNHTAANFLTALETDLATALTNISVRATTTVTTSLPSFSWDTASVVWNTAATAVDLLDFGVVRYY